MTKEIKVFCDSTEIANKLSNALEGSEAYGEEVSISNSEESDIREVARQEGIPDTKYSIAQVESSHSS